jgi:tRNA G10  N-methylase Trm11
MKQSLLILGRQPALGLAELESLYGPSLVKLVGSSSAIVDLPFEDINFDRLGGSISLCEVLDRFDGQLWAAVEAYLLARLPDKLKSEPNTKLRFGLSVIDFDVTPQQLMATGLKFKKVVQRSGRSVRFVPNKELTLNAAQVIHNGLIKPNGLEVFLVRDGSQTIVARTVKVQDIDSYTIRDRGRPKRDARVGMLPPKLAQIIINLAGVPPEPEFEITVLDPFCGTGVILQEALLMGYKATGSDIEPRMVAYSRANLDWLEAKFNIPVNNYDLVLGDATHHKWTSNFKLVASETYLGRPFTEQPGPDILTKTVKECNLIIKKFLLNIAEQIPSGSRLCLAVPAWQISPNRFKHLPLIDHLDDLGYNQVSFKGVSNDQLLYYRENQIVGRKLLVLVRE